VFQWVHRGADTALNPPTASPSQVAVDEHAGKVGTEQQWLYAAIDVEMKRLGSVVSDQRGTDLAVGALVRLAEKIRLLSRNRKYLPGNNYYRITFSYPIGWLQASRDQ
jgi:putative transposase